MQHISQNYVITIFFSVLLFSFLLEASILPRRGSPQKTIGITKNFIIHSQAFIHKLLQTHFINCELLHISQNHSTPEYSHQYLEKFPFSSGNFIATFSTNVTYNRSEDVHRFNTAVCSIALIFVPEYSVELSEWLFQTITPTYSPIIRKDEDHFVFVSFSASASDQLLMSPHFDNKIRYKISLAPQTDVSRTYSGLLVKTVDLYGKNVGQPVLKEMVRLDGKAISFSHSIFQHTQDLFPDTTHTFNGKVFRVSNPRSKTYFDVKVRDGKYYGKRGLYKIWLDVMMEKYNFSADVFESSLSGGSGKQLPNGTWGGTVGDVMYGVADMGAFVGHTFSRDKLVGYSATITYEWMFFITHTPKTYYTSTAIFRPLSFVLWIGFFISLIFMGFTFKILLRDQWSFAPMINFTVTSFLEQDADHYINLKSTSVRVLVSFWLIFSLIFSTAYRGKLVSLIAFPAMTWVPRTYEDLAYSDFRAGLHVVGKGGAADSIFSSSKNRAFQIINSRMEIFSDPKHCMKKALTEEIACVLWKCHFEYGLHEEFTDKFGRSPFHTSSQTSYFLHDGFIWEPRAVFRHHIDRTGWSILETGISQYWLKNDQYAVMKMRFEGEKADVNGTKQHIVIESDEGPEKLKLAQFKGLFILFFCGLSFATASWLKEKFGKKANKYFKRRILDFTQKFLKI